jgi:hypothetical protein
MKRDCYREVKDLWEEKSKNLKIVSMIRCKLIEQ